LQRRVPTEDPPKIFGNALCECGCTQKIHTLVEFFVDRSWEVDRTLLVAWGVEGSDTDGEAESEVLAEVVEDTEATDTELDD
jgi:hypothetical protein